MKLEQIQKYKIFVDLDGTLVDFAKKALEVTGISMPPEAMDSKTKRQFWGSVIKYEKNGGEFWGEMDFLPDGKMLWDYIKKYDPTVLTASGTAGDAPREKREWTAKHLGSDVKIIVVKASVDKAEYAAANHILIDDASRAIKAWDGAGGIPIFHTSALQSIRQLQELGL